MKHPYIPVDFNEMLEPDLVLLSKTDIKIDASGAVVEFREGLHVQIYEDDIGINGEPERLVADGVVERNRSDRDWASAAKWCCRIDARGIRHEPAAAG